MRSKQLTARTNKAPAGSVPGRASPSRVNVGPKAKSGNGSALPVMKLSFSMAPFVSIVSRHVKVSAKARQAIERDLAEVLGHADVQLLTSTEALIGERPRQAREADPVLTTEQAAQLVGVSRPFMAKLIDSGAVELHQKVGNQRRVLRSAVARWRAGERARQASSLKRLAEDLDEEIFSS